MKKHLRPTPKEARTLAGEGRSFLFEIAIPGALAGIVAGTVLLLFYMALSAAFGHGFLTLPKMMAGIFWRDLHTDQMPWQALPLGLMIHYTVSLHLGILYALAIPRRFDAPFVLMPLSLLYGMLAYVVLNYFVVEWASPPMRRELLQGFWLMGHAAFGALLPLALTFRQIQWTSRGRMREVPTQS